MSEELQQASLAPIVKRRLAELRRLFNRLVDRVRASKTPIVAPEEARTPIDSRETRPGQSYGAKMEEGFDSRSRIARENR